MKTQKNTQYKGITLIELTLVISIVLVLVSTTTIGISYYRDWQTGLAAGEDLKAVYQAQKLFLADNPTTPLASITAANIIAHLPNGMTAIPVVKGLDDEALTIDFNSSPPRFTSGGATYDKSGSNDNSVWDAGK